MMAIFSKEKRRAEQNSLPAVLSKAAARITQREIKAAAAVGLLAAFLVVIFFCLPAYRQVRLLQQEKIHWQSVLQTGLAKPKYSIPALSQIPELIEQCRQGFVEAGVKVDAINVESFGAGTGERKGSQINSSLVRFHLLGTWPKICTALQKLEGAQAGNLEVQEAVLSAEGGDILLQIYFSNTGD